MDVDFYNKIDVELSRIPYCSSKCNYYTVCPVCDRSATQHAICALRMLDRTQRRRFVNLYLRGRDGFKAESTELLFNLSKSLNLKDSSADMITYIDTLIKIDRAFKVDIKKIVETPKIEQEEVPDKVDVVVTEKAKPMDPYEKAVRKVETELDNNIESLFNSPVVDQIRAKMKVDQFKFPVEKKVVAVKVDSHVTPSTTDAMLQKCGV